LILIIEILDTAGVFMDVEQADSVRPVMAEDSTDREWTAVMAEAIMDKD